MNEIVKSFDASAFFQNCNQIEMFFENAYEKLQYLQDDQLTDLYGYLSITHKHSWKMQCAILAEAQGRVKKRGGRIEEMEKEAGEFGIGRRPMFYRAQIWNKFFQDEEKDFISDRGGIYKFDHFLDGYTWFREALSADNPLEAIHYAEKQYDELDGKYSTKDFRKDIKHHFQPVIKIDWLKVDDVWNFSTGEAGCGTPGYPGMIPAQVVENLLQRNVENDDKSKTPFLRRLRVSSRWGLRASWIACRRKVYVVG